MQCFDVAAAAEGFDVLATRRHTQAASMVLQPNATSGGPHNRHEADQWLCVVTGSGSAVVDGRDIPLTPGTLVLIEAGEAHEVRAGPNGLCTVNIYGPPEY